MRRTRASWLLALSLLIAALPFVAVAPATGQEAEAELGISPVVGQLATAPGRTIEETVTIVNLSDGPLQVGMALDDLEVDVRGRFSAVPSESRPSSAVPWGFVEPQGLQLPAGNSRDIKVALTPPEGTAPGGYSAALRFMVESRGRTTEIVHPVLLDVGAERLVRSARISSIFVPSRSIGSTIPVTIAIENTGPLHVAAQGTLIVTDATSRVTARIPVPRSIVMPGKTRIISVDVPAPLIPWRARVRADVGFGPGLPRDSMSTSGFAFSWFGIAVIMALVVLVLWTVLHLVRRRIRSRRSSVEVPQATPAERAGRKTPPPPAAPVKEPAVRRTALPVKPAEPAAPGRVVVSQPALTDEELDRLWGPVVARAKKERVGVSEPGAPARSTAEIIALKLAGSASPEPEEEAEPDVPEAEPEAPESEPEAPEAEPDAPEADREEEPRVIVLPDAKPRSEAAASEPPVESKRVIRLEPEPKQAEPVLEPIVAESFPEPASLPGALPSPVIAAATGSEGPRSRPRLTVLPRETVVEEPGSPLTAAAVDRRARVALDMLHEGPGRTGARVEVALDVLHTVKANLTVNSKVEEAYEAARKARDRHALAPLSLALAAVGSPAAPAALLRAYATAPDALADSLLAAIRALSAEELKANRRLVTALPSERRAAVRGE
jgi:hypothetical protein